MLDGLWIVENYDSYSVYPKESYGYLILGIGLTVIAFLIIQFKNKQITRNEEVHHLGSKKDNRDFINKVWANKMKVGDKAVGFMLVTLAVIAIFNLGLAINLLIPIICLGMVLFGFIFIMHDDGTDEVDEPPKSKFMRIVLRLMDYKTHPFSLPLILFILIIVSFLLSKQYGFTLSLGTSGMVAGLPETMFLEAALVFTCGFIYIIQHGDFFGIRQANQSDHKLLAIHFIVLISSGSTFFIWLFILFDALFTG